MFQLIIRCRNFSILNKRIVTRFFNSSNFIVENIKSFGENEYTVDKLPDFNSHANLKTIVPIFKKASIYNTRIALKDEYGKYSYDSLSKGTKTIAELITNALNGRTDERVVFLSPNDAHYVLIQWAIWAAGQIAVPLSPYHPSEMIQYYVNDCRANLIITTPKYAELMDDVAKKTKIQLIVIDDSIRRMSMFDSDVSNDFLQKNDEVGQNINFYQDRSALIIYTSGTTGNPKGVVLTHRNLQTQIMMLIKSWRWNSNDCILHTLPLHHIHGIVNVLMCPLYVGAKCVMLNKFDPRTVWSYLLGVNVRQEDRVNIYMGVPTIYSKLIQEYDEIFKNNSKMVEYVNQTLKNKLRLMVSGSASLPIVVFNRWFDISGHKLLERYGMSETGMTISNLYDNMSSVVSYSDLKHDEIFTPSIREPGYVGLPLPSVSVRLAEKLHGNKYRTILECSGGSYEDPTITFNYFDEKTTKLIENNLSEEKEKENCDIDNCPVGEILVKGENVFKEYYGKHMETQLEFTEDGWFKTGDTGLYDPRKKLFKILGRTSVDIIKSGGYKISALHIETVMLEHPDIKEVAVVSLPDITFGEKVAAVIVLNDKNLSSAPGLIDWTKNKLAAYAVPRLIRTIDELPRNAMGKVNKKKLIKQVFADCLDQYKNQV